jgi:hypothetical protein
MDGQRPCNNSDRGVCQQLATAIISLKTRLLAAACNSSQQVELTPGLSAPTSKQQQFARGPVSAAGNRISSLKLSF